MEDKNPKEGAMFDNLDDLAFPAAMLLITFLLGLLVGVALTT